MNHVLAALEAHATGDIAAAINHRQLAAARAELAAPAQQACMIMAPPLATASMTLQSLADPALAPVGAVASRAAVQQVADLRRAIAARATQACVVATPGLRDIAAERREESGWPNCSRPA